MKKIIIVFITVVFTSIACNNDENSEIKESIIKEYSKNSNTQLGFENEIEILNLKLKNNSDKCKDEFYKAIYFSIEENYQEALQKLNSFDSCSENIGGSYKSASVGLKQIILESQKINDFYPVRVSLRLLIPVLDSLDRENFSMFIEDSSQVHTVNVD